MPVNNSNSQSRSRHKEAEYAMPEQLVQEWDKTLMEAVWGRLFNQDDDDDDDAAKLQKIAELNTTSQLLNGHLDKDYIAVDIPGIHLLNNSFASPSSLACRPKERAARRTDWREGISVCCWWDYVFTQWMC